MYIFHHLSKNEIENNRKNYTQCIIKSINRIARNKKIHIYRQIRRQNQNALESPRILSPFNNANVTDAIVVTL